MRTVARRTLLGSAGGLLAAPALVRAQGVNGVALVVGNSNYKWEAPLPNVKRDVPDIARTFQALGLKTELREDLGHGALKQAIEKFAEASRGARFAAVYFAGHGVWWKGLTYLVPVDVDVSGEKAVDNLLSRSVVLASTKGASGRLIVFDNCRNSPYGGWRQREARASAFVSTTLAAEVLVDPNILWLSSTAPGCVALDGPPGQTSPFAAALVQELSVPSVDMQTLPANIRRRMLQATEGRQLTHELSTYEAPFLLGAAGKQPAGNYRASHDPSRIVELNNAYNVAKQMGEFLPPGLIAYRPPNGSPDVDKVGAYKSEIMQEARPGVWVPVPAIFVVLSVPDSNSAEMIFASKRWVNGVSSSVWRYFPAKNVGNALTFTLVEGSPDQQFKWRDRNSGTFSPSPAVKPFPFTRLD